MTSTKEERRQTKSMSFVFSEVKRKTNSEEVGGGGSYRQHEIAGLPHAIPPPPPKKKKKKGGGRNEQTKEVAMDITVVHNF